MGMGRPAGAPPGGTSRTQGPQGRDVRALQGQGGCRRRQLPRARDGQGGLQRGSRGAVVLHEGSLRERSERGTRADQRQPAASRTLPPSAAQRCSLPLGLVGLCRAAARPMGAAHRYSRCMPGASPHPHQRGQHTRHSQHVPGVRASLQLTMHACQLLAGGSDALEAPLAHIRAAEDAALAAGSFKQAHHARWST
jgi:hypothetical protein